MVSAPKCTYLLLVVEPCRLDIFQLQRGQCWGTFHAQKTHVIGQTGRCAEPGTGMAVGVSSEQQNLLEAAK